MIRKILPHIIGWILYISANIFYHIHYRHTYIFWVLVFTYTLKIFTVYTLALYFLPKFLKRKKYFRLFLSILFSYFLYLFIDYFIEHYFEAWYYGIKPTLTGMDGYVFPILLLYTPVAVIGFLIYYIRVSEENALRLEKEKSNKLIALNQQLQLEAAKLVADRQIWNLEKENLRLEFAYLQAQINPHFLKNTLASIGANIRPIDKAAYEQLSLLGDLMSYSLEKTIVNGKVFLIEEVKAIETLIEIFKLRYEEECAIVLHKEGNIDNLYIVPHTLLTLVENATKHGLVNDTQKPLNIILRVNFNQLYFRTENWINNDKYNTSTAAVGIENIKRRLEIAYKDKYVLTKENGNGKYITELILTL
jgi:two-component system, LytTR family, sensor kinase